MWVKYKYIINETLSLCQVFYDTLFHNKFMITIAEIQVRLREAIRQSGLTQAEIARRLGVTSNTVNKYMKANKFPSLETFANLCKILDVSADEILGL